MITIPSWMVLDKKLEQSQHEVREEITRALMKFPEFNGPHEGYAVILGELDELWEIVRQKNKTRAGEGGQDKTAMRKEACQVAAMAIRFMVELT